MVLRYDMGFALKNEYGEYETRSISLFEMEKINKMNSVLQVDISKNKEYRFKIKCSLCGEYHQYKYNLNDLTKRDMVIGGCESLGVPLFYLGNNMKVLTTISKLNSIREKNFAMI